MQTETPNAITVGGAKWEFKQEWFCCMVIFVSKCLSDPSFV